MNMSERSRLNHSAGKQLRLHPGEQIQPDISARPNRLFGSNVCVSLSVNGQKNMAHHNRVSGVSWAALGSDHAQNAVSEKRVSKPGQEPGVF